MKKFVIIAVLALTSVFAFADDRCLNYNLHFCQELDVPDIGMVNSMFVLKGLECTFKEFANDVEVASGIWEWEEKGKSKIIYLHYIDEEDGSEISNLRGKLVYDPTTYKYTKLVINGVEFLSEKCDY